MDKIKIEKLLVSYGFNKSKLIIGRDTEVFSEVFIKDNKEAYILFEGLINVELIDKYQKKILWFQNWSDNEILRYNINLLIPYKSSQVNRDEVNKYIFKFERDSHICRKIFLDLDNENCIDLLPFNKINLSKSDVNSNSLKKELVKVLHTDNIYQELIKEDFDLELIKKELLSK
ncbi:hypothetical protein CM240_1252 [Clostridium bornimense]|uniref:Uncharacterized protein n=1 Tax=Clostridium bornimense TaxID=1216932 RepID=W6RUT7_9CLOT|nr:hypothetical protein [Clostridium bornimense]CDM68416.1 hypothetical protein CM240_1252 [Clostridium bornimense]